MYAQRLRVRFGYLVGLFMLLVGTAVLAQESSSCGEGLRSFAHAMGESCIPEAPQQVVVLDTGELDNALALGAPVVGAPIGDVVQYQAYMSEQLDGIADTGSISEPNFEAILALAPDLILGSKQRYEAIYEQLSQIAPTVLTESLRVPWQDNFRLHADALGKTAEAEQLLADYAAHVGEVQAAIGEGLADTTISIIRFRPGQVRLYLKSSYIGYILQDVGLQRPESQDEDVFSAEISIEEMQQTDADYIFVTGYDVDDSERDVFLNSPLWQTLDALQNGRVIDVNDDTWIAGLGIQAANLVLDDLARLLGTPTAASTIICEAGFRLFDHELLTTDAVCIPENPERVAYLIYSSTLYPFGVKPIGSWGLERDTANFPMIADWITDGFNDIGMPPNLETLTQLAPDLMILPETRIGEAGEELPLIAPTILYDEHANWRDRHLMTGEIFGQLEEAEAQLAVVDQRIAELQTAVTAARGDVSDITVSVVRIFEPGNYFLASERYVAVEIMRQIGFNIPEAVQDLDDWGISLSDEQIDMANADVLILLGSTGGANNQTIEGDAMVAALMEDPLWNTLDAFKQGQVFTVKDNFQQTSLLAAHLIIDDLVRIFGVEIATANPYLEVASS